MMKSVKILGASLAAAATVSLSGGVASAHGSHHHYSGPYTMSGAHHAFTHHHGHRHHGFQFGPSYNHHWLGHHHFHHHMTFAEKQAAVVGDLTRADNRLKDLITRLSSAAADDPTGWQAQALPYVVAKEKSVAALITAVKAATDWDSLKAAFDAAHAGS